MECVRECEYECPEGIGTACYPHSGEHGFIFITRIFLMPHSSQGGGAWGSLDSKADDVTLPHHWQDRDEAEAKPFWRGMGSVANFVEAQGAS